MLATVVMGFVFLAEGVLDKKISEQIAFKLDEESYFTALISTKENYNMLVRKMIYLPGVEKVKVIGPEELNSKVTKAISAMKINIPLTAGGLSSNFVGMKVFFKDGLRDETKELVRNYLAKLAGEANLFLGNNISNIELFNGYKGIYNKIKQLLPEGFKLAAVVFWLYCVSIMRSPFLAIFMVAQKYQRSKNLALKASALANAVILGLIFLGITMAQISINYINLAMLGGVIIAGTVYMSKKMSWV